ncbi:uncharacterized protein SRS1_11351 [Sporisorium reilianum f. sp. reilianum]|uniref:Uncharacterized protein n=1 Tax=Sporisorium reilianum f. sp. reilianum TaxID=72559 RepID=A0A2N8UNQ0_9BASI|nr:uncharacterized protein SRS1_11351 [Sporisorium reilianum f. sp. reilianum]
MRLASLSLTSTLGAVLLWLNLVCRAAALPTPMRPEDLERLQKLGEQVKMPEWSEGSGWMNFKLYEHGSREEPMLPDSYTREWHLVNSPIRGVVTQPEAQHRLGVTANELVTAFDSRVIPWAESRAEQARRAELEGKWSEDFYALSARSGSDDEGERSIRRARTREVGLVPPPPKFEGLSKAEIKRLHEEMEDRDNDSRSSLQDLRTALCIALVSALIPPTVASASSPLC